MSVVIVVPDPARATHLVNALVTAAEVERRRDPALARSYTDLADEIGDGIDALPVPAGGTVPLPDAT